MMAILGCCRMASLVRDNMDRTGGPSNPNRGRSVGRPQGAPVISTRAVPFAGLVDSDSDSDLGPLRRYVYMYASR